ncbi:MAG: DUF402 domain-containing protein [Nocardioidaceae bacterium]|nr:DUF402 domain-containing protein [Nocardioidaceae bacterium]
MRRTTRVLTRKWPDGPHWEFDAVRLGVDAHGHWVGVPAGTLLARPDKAFTAWADHVVLLPHDAWWVATIYGTDEDRPVDFYVDITTPCVWSDDESSVSAVDLDLDVIREVDGRIWVDDEDEFAEHQVTLGYPGDVVERAVSSCAEVLAAMQAGRAPFDGIGLEWIARLKAAARS